MLIVICLQDTLSTLESDHIQPREVRFVLAYRIIVLNYTFCLSCYAELPIVRPVKPLSVVVCNMLQYLPVLKISMTAVLVNKVRV